MNRKPHHQQALIRALVIPKRQERYLELHAKPKRRFDAAREFAYFQAPGYDIGSTDSSFTAKPVGDLADPQIPGSRTTCQVIFECGELDGQEMLLDEALDEIVGRSRGSFLSGVEGRLAGFEDQDEDRRWILEPTERAMISDNA